jgi:ElaB/YqjD/DUF883 family membrane-anchored ribosome-binding protein
MFESGELRDELLALKADVSRLLTTAGDELFDASRNPAEAAADQIKAALNDLGDTFSEQEEHLESIVSERPITSLAAAFALGAIIGFMLRRY